MKILSYRNALATAALVPAIVIPMHSTTQAEDVISTENPDVIIVEDIVGSEVQKLPTYASTDLGTFTDINKLGSSIINAIKNFETSISFNYSGDLNAFQAGFSPELNRQLTLPGNDYAHGTISTWKYSYTSTGKVTMTLGYHGTAEQEQYVTNQVEAIAASLTKAGMSDFEKVKAVNDYVVTHTVYSKTAKTTPHHVYAYLKEGKAVCQAYALLTYRLLTEMGVEARYVVGHAGEAHAWNSVKIDGQWYHLDTTWNDSSFNGFDTLSNVGYRYFLVTSETLRKDHTWEEAVFPEATDNRYSYFHQIAQGIEHNGEIFYRNAQDSTLYKLNLTTGNKEQLLNLRVAYLEAHNEFIYFSNFSQGGYLTSYNLITGAMQVIDSSAVTQLHKLDGFLHYKVGSASKKYELPLSSVEQAVRNVDFAISKLSEFSGETELTAAREAYEALTEEQKQAVANVAKLAQLELLYPTNLAAANVVAQSSQNYSTTSSRQDLLTIIAEFDALTPAQQALVSTKNQLLAFKAIIDAQNAEIAAVNGAIANLKSTSKSLLSDIDSARKKYDALPENLKPEIANAAIIAKFEEDAALAQIAYTLIADLKNPSIDDIIAARVAYNAVQNDFKKHVTNLKTLTNLEAPAKNAIAAINAIDAIDPASTKFVAQVKAARKAYDRAGAQQKNITNGKEFLSIEKQALVFEQISKLKPSSAKYITEVTAAKKAYDALGDATASVKNIKILNDALEAIKPAQAVIATIDAVNATSADSVNAALLAVAALPKAQQKYVTNIKQLQNIEKTIKNALLAIKAINAIDPKSNKFLAQVKAARKAVDKAVSQSQLVTNKEAFEAIEKQALVFEKISKLKPSSAKYIAEVTAVKEAFDALGDNTTLVTNVAALNTAITAIQPAQAVVATITNVNASSMESIAAARKAFNTLPKTAQKYVTNIKQLQTIEKKVAPALKVIQQINDVKAMTPSLSTFLSKAAAMKKGYTALSQDNKALVTNTADYEKLVALYEIKNAQKTRKWTTVNAQTFETLAIDGVTADSFAAITAAFNKLKAGTGTATIAEIQVNVTKFTNAN